jgi:putative transposase
MDQFFPKPSPFWKAVDMRTKSLNHSTYQHQYHIVWGTKHRRKWLKDYIRRELITSFRVTLKKYPTLYIHQMNTDQDHVHIQIEIPPNIAVSDAVSRLKANSSLHLKKKFKFIREMYLEWDGIWSVGYFSSTVGLNEGQVKKYIEWQGKKEKPQTTRLF